MTKFRKAVEEMVYGRHWRANKKSKSGTAQKSYSGTGGTQAFGTYQGTWTTWTAHQDTGESSSVMWDYYMEQHPPRRIRVKGRLVNITHAGKWAPPWMYGELAEPNNAKFYVPHCPTELSSEGLIAGEIVAWRAWYWTGERLRSLFVDYEWEPDRPAVGEPANGYGIHGFKDEMRALIEYEACKHDVIFGQVAMWGDVVEYNYGYCSEFGRVHALSGPKRIRELYGAEKL